MVHLSRITSISNRLKNFLLATAFFATQIFVPLNMVIGTAHAAGDITVGTFEGQNSDSSWSPGNNTQFAEGDHVNYRFPLTSSAANTSGTIYVQFSKCMFTNYFAQYGNTSPATVTPGTEGVSGNDWEQPLAVSFLAAATVTVQFTLRISDTGGNCNGSSSHVSLNTKNQTQGDFANIGSKDIPIPASSIYYSPSLTISKVVNGGSALASDFWFTVSPVINGQTELHIPVGQNSVTVQDVNPDGSFTITEHGPAGYEFEGGTGDNCNVTNSQTGVMTATVTAGRPAINAICNFTNSIQKGSITIEKNAIPDSTQDFSFTTTGLSTDQTGFKLDNDDDNSLSDTQAFNNLPAGDYSITELSASGWDFDNIICTQGSDVDKAAGDPTVTVHLTAGENVTCTYTNRQRGQIIVHKVTTPENDTTNFTVTASGTSSVPGATAISGDVTRTDLSTTNDVTYDVAQGTYSVSEQAKDGWIEDDSECSDLTINGDTKLKDGIPAVECTIHNTKQAKLTIVKGTAPSAANQDFGFTVNNLDGDFTLNTSSNDTKVFSDLTPGQTYGVTEDNLSGWKLTNLSCTGIAYNWDNMSQGISFTLPAGADVTCTFTNTQLGSISGTKFIVNNDESLATDQSSAVNWQINLCDSSYSCLTAYTDANGDYSFNDLLPDNYNIVEVLKTGWTQIFSPSDVTLTAGETSTDNDFGNFENGSIGGYKFNDLNGDGKKQDNESKLSGWTIKLYDYQEQLLGSKVTDDNGDYEFTDLAPAIYKVCEEGQTNWTQTSTPTCYTVNIDQSGEENLTIIFGNQAQGTITINKDVDTDGDGTVDQTNVSNWTWDLSGDYITDSNYQNISTGTIKSNLPVGQYAIHEDQQTDYHFVSVACSDERGDLTVTQAETTAVDLTVGKNIVCTYTNARDTGGLTLKKDVINDDGGTATADQFTLHVKQNGSDVVGSPAAGSETGTTYSGLLTGTYVISEDTPLAGYEQTKIVCDGQETNAVTVTFNQTKNCTITNDDIAPTLTLKKNVVNNDGGIATKANFQATLNGTDVDWDAISTVSANSEYSLDEYSLLGGSGYDAGDWTCDSNVTVTGNKITLSLNQNVTCQITNNDKAPTLKLVKQVSGGTARESDWTLSATPMTTNTRPLSGAGDSFGSQTARANLEYSLSESSNVTDYTAGNWNCDGGQLNGNKLVLALDEDVIMYHRKYTRYW